MQKYFILSLLLFLSPLIGIAQLQDSTDFLEYSESTSDPEITIISDDQDMSSLHEKMDINSNDIASFYSSRLINTSQAFALVEHRKRFGRFICKEELQVVDDFDTATIRRLLPFINCSEPMWNENFSAFTIMKNAKHELIVRQKCSLQDETGFSNDGEYPYYKGSPLYLMGRYRIQSGQDFSAGVLVEKDAGEMLLPSSVNGRMDFFSWHLMIKPGRFVRRLCLGDFQLQYGQGLVVWKGLSLGKGGDIGSIYRHGAGIRPYTSSGESGFFRGLAISIGDKKWKLDSWFSYRKLDAALFYTDTNYNNLIVSSILESGLHRDAYEISKRAVLPHSSTGIRIERNGMNLKSGFTIHFQRYGYALWPGDDPYEVYDPAGRKFLNLGYDISFAFGNTQLFAESAMDIEGDPAIVCGLLMMPDRKWSVGLLYRNYQPDFQNNAADAFREGSRTQNEKGFYLGLRWECSKVFRVQAYLDQFSIPWLRYVQSAPSNGTEWSTELIYTPSRNTTVSMRFRGEEKPSDVVGESIKLPMPSARKNIRWDFQTNYNKRWQIHARCEWADFAKNDLYQSGILFYQELGYKPMDSRYNIFFRFTLFNSSGYDARIYSYEKDISGVFSLPAFYGEGQKWYLLARYKLMKNMDLWLRFGKSAANTDGDLIQNSEVKSQLRWQF